MSVKNADIKSLSSERVNLLDLDYYSITEHITETDLFARIKNFSQGYLEPATLSILNSRINNSIASIPIIPSVTSSDRIEDVGHRVYITIQELMRAVDAQLFPLIVALNFDYQSCIYECREARITFKTEYDSLKQIVDTPLDKPTTEVYDLRADLQIYDFTERVHSESYQPGPFSSSTPSDRAQQITDAIAKESARIKMESRRQFLKAFDDWESSKKNTKRCRFTASQIRTRCKETHCCRIRPGSFPHRRSSYRQQSSERHHLALSRSLSHLERVHHDSCHTRRDSSSLGSQKSRWHGCNHL